MAGQCGVRAPATKTTAEHIYVKLGTSRVQWWQWVEVGWPETAPRDDLGGCPSSGELGLVARRHGEVRGVVMRAPGGAVRLTGRVARLLRGRSHVGDELYGGACS